MKKFLSALLINIILFVVIFLIHFRLLHPGIVFRAGIIDVLLAGVIGSAINYWRDKNAVNILASFLIILFAGLSYVSLIPTMVDRSVTVYILLNLQAAGAKGLSENTIVQRLQNKRLFDKRFEELNQLGIIEIKNNQVYLTPKGQFSANVFLYNMRALDLGQEYQKFT